MSDPTSTRTERIQARAHARREREKQATRAAILAAARTLFERQGYQAFSLRQVAELAGYSPGAIYLYFENKDALLLAIADDGAQQFSAYLRNATEPIADPWERLTAGFNAYVRFAQEHPVAYQLLFIDRPDLVARSSADDTIKLTAMDVLQQAVGEAMDAGVINPGDVEASSFALWALVHGLAAMHIRMGVFFSPDQLEQTLLTARRMAKEGLHPR